VNKHSRPGFNDYYRGIWGGYLFRWLDHAKIRVIAGLLKDMPTTSRILDLGCGSASISSCLAHRFPHLFFLGADGDHGLLRLASARGLATRQVNFDECLPFADAEWDVVLMIDTIEHVKSRSDALREVCRILKPDGLLVVFTPPYDSLVWNLGETMHRWVTRRQADHISPFTRESLGWCLSERFSHFSVTMLNFGLTLCGVGRVQKEGVGR